MKSILELLKFAERLKCELRHSWLSSGRQESVAEHCWQMALFAVLVHSKLEHEVCLERALKMIIVHDLVEAEAGDVPFFEKSERKSSKQVREQAAMERIREMLPGPDGKELSELWYEFEACESREAKFAKALDNLEVQFQHNLASLASWEEIEYDLVYTKMDKHCEHDACLRELCLMIKKQAEVKMLEGGVDCEEVKRRVEQNIR